MVCCDSYEPQLWSLSLNILNTWCSMESKSCEVPSESHLPDIRTNQLGLYMTSVPCSSQWHGRWFTDFPPYVLKKHSFWMFLTNTPWKEWPSGCDVHQNPSNKPLEKNSPTSNFCQGDDSQAFSPVFYHDLAASITSNLCVCVRKWSIATKSPYFEG